MNSSRVSQLIGQRIDQLGDARKDPARFYHPSRRYDYSIFQRPPANYRGGPVTFMLMTVTQRRATEDNGASPSLVLHGITEERNSVWCNVRESYPYFYAYFPTRRDYEVIVGLLETHLRNLYMQRRKPEDRRSQYILNWQVVYTEDICDYKGPGDRKEPHLKIFMQDKKYIEELAKQIQEMRVSFFNADLGDWESLERGRIYESNIPYEIQSLVARDLYGCFWVTVRNARVVQPLQGRAQIEVTCNLEDLVAHPERADIAPIRILSYDLECETVNGERRFVNAETDPIISCGIYMYEHGRPEKDDVKMLLSLRPSEDAQTDELGDGIHHFDYDDERDVLCGLRDIIIAADPDIITGYNIGPFDNVYCSDRARALHMDRTFADSSRAKGWSCYPKKKVFKSKAQGTKEGAIVKWVGRIQFDLLEYFQKNLKLHAYGLDAVSEKFLGERKAEMPYELIYPYHHGTPAERRKLYKYCVRDAYLPVAMIRKNLYIVSLVEMCRAVGVTFDMLLEKGQQAKTRKRLLQETKVERYVKPSVIPPKREYTGAIVVQPICGFYEVPLAVNDFSSLYPTIMMAYNLCYTTKAKKAFLESLGYVQDRDFVTPPGILSDYGFVQRHIKPGLIPNILNDLLARRKAAKEEQARYEAEGNKAMAKIYEMRQMALKLTANSLYGYTSADYLPVTEIAETVTAFGRDMITMTSKLIEGRFNRQTPDVARCLKEGIDPNAEFTGAVIYFEYDAKVVYGDSVTGDTWIPLRTEKGDDVSCDIADIFCDWQLSPLDGKEFAVPTHPLFVYSDAGWTAVECVIRHKTRKSIYRITTRGSRSSVCVTSDHSLLACDGSLIKPTDVCAGRTRLLSYDQDYDDGLVECVELLGATDDYVYDLQTENHHFAAGRGTLVVHNTDSVFISFGNVSVERARDLALQASAYCKPFYAPPNDSIFEKVIFPCLLGGKKRYAGIWHTWPKPNQMVTKQDAKGIETQRRDWTRLCTKTLNEGLRALLFDRDKNKLVSLVHETIARLYANKTPMHDIVLTKGYTKSRAEYDATFKSRGYYPVHISVALKMEKRDPATAPKNGDRIPYVMVAGVKREYIKGKGWKDVNTAEYAEDPLYVLKNGLVIDADWYVQKQLVGPLMRLFRVALCDDQEQIQDVSKYYEEHPEKTDAYRKLFVGPHMNKRVVAVPKDIPFFKNLEVVPPCVGCGGRAPRKPAHIPIEYDACCSSCDREAAYGVTRARLHEARKYVEHVQQTCVTCQKGTPYQEIVCANKSCQNWWERISSAKDLTDMEDLIKRF